MAAYSDKTQPNSADIHALNDLQAVNAQLIIAGLREQTIAEHLHHQLAFTTAITTSLGEGVYVLDTVGRCTFVNPVAEQLLGWTSAELNGQPIWRVFPAEPAHEPSPDTVPRALRDVLRAGTTQRDEDALLVHRDGTLVSSAYSAAPIITDEHVVGAVITFRDMTDIRRLQRMRDEYLALMSHDLRAPLTAILGRAQILVRRLTEQNLTRDAENARIMVESGFRMSAIIEDVLERSRVDTTKRAPQQLTVDLVALVQRMIEQTVAPSERARVTLDAAPGLSVVAAATQIERVVVNLLGNALKFSAYATPINVQVYEQDGQAMIAVSDTGDGIAPDDLPHLFDKQYRARAVGEIEGDGLGLYSSRLIVEAHGGRLWAESVVGQGSTFTIALPLPA